MIDMAASEYLGGRLRAGSKAAMNLKDLSGALKQAYFGAAEREKAVSVHLFGIEYADHLDGHSLVEITDAAGLNKSYAVEIRKGMNLAKYVTLNKNS